MAIDIGALRRFQSTWGPVIDVIPDVINMAEQQADLERALNKKSLELDSATKEVETVFAEADKRLIVLNKELSDVVAMKSTVLAEIESATKDAEVKAKAAEAEANARFAVVIKSIEVKNAELAETSSKIAAKTDAALAEHAKVVAGMNAEIQELEKRKAAAEKALDTLRAKLG
jgi:delta 1-pyrroline-5-carboxylate dehydrogenase